MINSMILQSENSRILEWAVTSELQVISLYSGELLIPITAQHILKQGLNHYKTVISHWSLQIIFNHKAIEVFI